MGRCSRASFSALCNAYCNSRCNGPRRWGVSIVRFQLVGLLRPSAYVIFSNHEMPVSIFPGAH